MSIWFYEEQKHALVLMEYLRRFRPDLVPTEEELHAVRFEFDPAPPLETLMLHFCGEIRLNHWYRRAAEWHTEPVIRKIYDLISRDEARHGGAYLRFMKRAIERGGDEAHARVREDRRADGEPAPRRQAAAPDQPARQPASCSRNDTVQSRLPDPAWLERWLDEQIRFDATWEKRVVAMILHNLSSLFGQTFESVQQLNRFRKSLAAGLSAAVDASRAAIVAMSTALSPCWLVVAGGVARTSRGRRTRSRTARAPWPFVVGAAARLPRGPAVLHDLSGSRSAGGVARRAPAGRRGSAFAAARRDCSGTSSSRSPGPRRG